MSIELNDGNGSYVCALGHVHDYKKFNIGAVEREIADPDTKVYNSADEMWLDLGVEN